MTKEIDEAIMFFYHAIAEQKRKEGRGFEYGLVDELLCSFNALVTDLATDAPDGTIEIQIKLLRNLVKKGKYFD